MLKMVCCLVLVGVAAAAPQDHSIQKRQTTVTDLSSIARIFDPSTVSLTTVGGIILVLLALDVAFTLVFATVFSGRSRQDYTFPFAGEFLGNFVNSIDVVEAAMTYSAIEEEACRFKAVCRAEYAAAKNPIARLAINTINSNLNGLSKYGAAVAAGLNGEDCDLLYSACPEAVGFF